MKKFEEYFLAINRWALILILAVMSVIISPTWCCATPPTSPSNGPKKWPGT